MEQIPLTPDHRARARAKDNITPAWVSVYEAAVHSSLSVCTLNKMWRQGIIRSKKIGGRRLFKVTELDEDLRNAPEDFSTKTKVPA